MRITFALPLLLALSMPALAQSADLASPADAIPGQGGLTYLDLLRLAAPDLGELDGTYEGTISGPLRSLAFAEDPAVVDFPVSFRSIDAIAFDSDGAPLLALMLNTDNGAAVVAVFDPVARTLVDIADVAADQHTSFDHPTVLPLGEGDDGLLVSSSHFNSSQGYRMTSVLALMDGQLREVADVFTLRENYCGVNRDQEAVISAAEGQPGRWQPFTITVTEITLPAQEDCGSDGAPEPGTRAVAATYLWNEAAGAYQPDSNALDKLYRDTEARF
jgi:hypothetical protein